MRTALVGADGIIQNIIEIDPDSDYAPASGLKLVDISDRVMKIGGRWKDGVYTDPEPTENDDSSEKQVEEVSAILFVAREVIKTKVKDKTLTEAEVPHIKALFPDWKVNLDVAVGEIYIFNDVLVQCIQAHKTQSNWTPDLTPALWNIYRDRKAVNPWVQPGSTNPYRLGDRVTYNGKTWESIHDANVWAPPTQWKEVTV